LPSCRKQVTWLPILRSCSAFPARIRRVVEQFPAEATGWQDFRISPPAWHEALEDVEHFSPANAFRSFDRLYAARFSKTR